MTFRNYNEAHDGTDDSTNIHKTWHFLTQAQAKFPSWMTTVRLLYKISKFKGYFKKGGILNDFGCRIWFNPIP